MTSPELATHFAEEKANGKQAKSGWRTKNTSPVVMQILPQATGKSLRDGIYVHRLKCMWTSFCAFVVLDFVACYGLLHLGHFNFFFPYFYILYNIFRHIYLFCCVRK